MDNMDAFNGFHLCEIIDCKLNRDNICSVNANFDNADCKQYRVLPENPIRKNYDGLFHKKDCIALDLQSSSKGAQRKWLSGDKKFLIKEQFYYQLRYWNDDLVEVIASSIGKQLHINCMEQWLGNISGQDVYYKSLTFEQCLAKMSKKPFHDWDKALNYFAAIAVLPEATEVKISKKLLPNLLAEPYLVYSFKQLGIGVCLCD
ncbi:MAG: hypothetical protein NC347_08930 [Clostridium sp.]|nr:hypothetical protein [Clostridium sp.]